MEKKKCKQSKKKPKRHQLIKGIMALAKTSKKPMTVKQINNLLQAYDLNIVICYEMENRRCHSTIKDLRRSNTWLRKKLDVMYLSQNAYVKRVRENNEEYEVVIDELKDENKLFRKKLIAQWNGIRKFGNTKKKDN